MEPKPRNIAQARRPILTKKEKLVFGGVIGSGLLVACGAATEIVATVTPRIIEGLKQTPVPTDTRTNPTQIPISTERSTPTPQENQESISQLAELASQWYDFLRLDDQNQEVMKAEFEKLGFNSKDTWVTVGLTTQNNFGWQPQSYQLNKTNETINIFPIVGVNSKDLVITDSRGIIINRNGEVEFLKYQYDGDDLVGTNNKNEIVLRVKKAWVDKNATIEIKDSEGNFTTLSSLSNLEMQQLNFAVRRNPDDPNTNQAFVIQDSSSQGGGVLGSLIPTEKKGIPPFVESPSPTPKPTQISPSATPPEENPTPENTAVPPTEVVDPYKDVVLTDTVTWPTEMKTSFDNPYVISQEQKNKLDQFILDVRAKTLKDWGVEGVDSMTSDQKFESYKEQAAKRHSEIVLTFAEIEEITTDKTSHFPMYLATDKYFEGFKEPAQGNYDYGSMQGYGWWGDISPIPKPGGGFIEFTYLFNLFGEQKNGQGYPQGRYDGDLSGVVIMPGGERGILNTALNESGEVKNTLAIFKEENWTTTEKDICESPEVGKEASLSPCLAGLEFSASKLQPYSKQSERILLTKDMLLKMLASDKVIHIHFFNNRFANDGTNIGALLRNGMPVIDVLWTPNLDVFEGNNP